MNKEAVVPEKVLIDGVKCLSPYNFPFPNENLSIEDQDRLSKIREKILNTYLHKFDDSLLRNNVFEFSNKIILDRRLVEPNQENTTIKKTVLTMTIRNQPDRRLLNTWQAMLDTDLQFDDPLNQTLASIGNPTYGLYGIAFMPDVNGDWTKPPLDLIPEALSKWAKTIAEKDVTNQALIFFKNFTSHYSAKDTLHILQELKHHSYPKWLTKQIKTLPTKLEAQEFISWAKHIEPKPVNPANKDNDAISSRDMEVFRVYLSALALLPDEESNLLNEIRSLTPPLWTQPLINSLLPKADPPKKSYQIKLALKRLISLLMPSKR
jgi:hypothetical protein